MHLTTVRPGAVDTTQKFTVYRTSTELQDIQIALLEEVNAMIDDTRGPDDPGATYQVIEPAADEADAVEE